MYFATVNFYHQLLGTIAGLIYIAIQFCITGESLSVHTPEMYFWLVFICFVDFIGCNAVTIAFQKDQSSFVAIIGFMIVVYGYIADQLMFSVSIAGIDLMSALLIFGVTISTAIYKMYL